MSASVSSSSYSSNPLPLPQQSTQALSVGSTQKTYSQQEIDTSLASLTPEQRQRYEALVKQKDVPAFLKSQMPISNIQVDPSLKKMIDDSDVKLGKGTDENSDKPTGLLSFTAGNALLKLMAIFYVLYSDLSKLKISMSISSRDSGYKAAQDKFDEQKTSFIINVTVSSVTAGLSIVTPICILRIDDPQKAQTIGMQINSQLYAQIGAPGMAYSTLKSNEGDYEGAKGQQDTELIDKLSQALDQVLQSSQSTRDQSVRAFAGN